MEQAVPPYLFSFVVGEIVYQEVGLRTKVFVEAIHAVLNAATKEFDLLVLPPSFHYGGTENLRMVFLTPTKLFAFILKTDTPKMEEEMITLQNIMPVELAIKRELEYPKLSEALVAQETESWTIKTPNLYEEVKYLKDEILELESNCNELTDENLELLFKLKESNKDSVVDYNLKDNEGKFGNLIIELKSRVEELKSYCLLKEEEIQSQNCRVKDLEGHKLLSHMNLLIVGLGI
ncbi:hypothetical protein L1887_18848 [Cichorium endivia]|nr:hypothetical protein L1887_18848 [Cichorium endivia]